MTFWENIFFAFWFFLPAGLANLFPIFAAHTPGLAKLDFPLDFHLTFRGRPLLGENKTIRGLLVGIIIATAAVLIQKYIYVHWPYLQTISPLDYTEFNPVILGLLLALGALGGDAVKSFFKRQMDIASGESWFFFDQLDYVIGVILITYFYAPLGWEQYLYLIVLWFVVHILTTIIGHAMGLKAKAI